MLGKLLSTVIGIFISVYVICLILFFFLHQEVRENIQRLNYETAELVSTQGILNDRLFGYLSESAGRFGDYTIRLKLEKQIKPGIYDTFHNKDEIVNRRLQVGDRLSIYLEDKNPSLFGRLINSTVFFHSPDAYIEGRIRSVKTAMIAKNARDIVKGYDVIVEISRRLVDPNLAIYVATKANGAGKYYGSMGHAYITEQNPAYGDSPDEAELTGGNYIFENGDFLRRVEYYSDKTEKCISYIQQ